MNRRRYVFPIEGLRLPSDCVIGPVTVRSGASAAAVVDAALASWPASHDREPHRRRMLESGTVADIWADSSGIALAEVGEALDLLRVFQRVHSTLSTQVGAFGLPGQLNRLVVPYLTDGPSPGHGFTAVGHPMGTELAQADLAAWSIDRPFQLLASSIGAEVTTEGAARMRSGVALLGQSLRAERGSALRYVSALFALDALLAGGSGPQTLAVARRVAYLGCGRVGGGLCGRDRATCSYLALRPGKDRATLYELAGRSKTDTWWRCSEWLQVLDWYRRRGDYVHRGLDPDLVNGETAPDYWIFAVLIAPILDWLVQHQAEPIKRLDEAINELPPPPDWEDLSEERGL